MFKKKDGAIALDVAVKTPKQLIEVMSKSLQAEGAPEEVHNFEKALEVKKALLETKANEVEHTGNTGYGAELIPGAVQTTDFLDLAPKFSDLLPLLRGFHGRNMAKIMEVPIIGELPLHLLDAEWTTGAPYTKIAQGKGLLPTAKTTITQKKYLFSVDISDEEARFCTVIDIVAKIQQKLAESAARTMTSVIINGDTVLTANTNINSIDGTPAGTEAYLGADGLRKKALASATTSIDGGTLAFADFVSLVAALGENGASESDIVYLFGTYSRTLGLGIDEFKNQYINGAASTVLTGRVPNFLGSPVITNRYLAKANTAGKVATGTPSNNTKGQVIAFHRDAVQYGFNGDYNLEIFRVPGYGWQVLGYYFMGMSVVSGEVSTDPTVAMLYNLS